MLAGVAARKSLSSLSLSSRLSNVYGFSSSGIQRRTFASSSLDGIVRDVPITKVVLYKHGVGYFERKCTVENNQKVLLAFRNTDMNDMLKTVAVREESREGAPTGTITNIEYESRLDANKEMSDISINLTNGGDKTMAGLLPQLKGVAVELQTTNNRTLRGVVMGIEQKETVKEITTVTGEGHRVTKEDRSTREFVTLLCEQGSPASTFIQAAELTDVNKLTILDDLINTDVTRILDLFRTSKKNNLKELIIHTKGQGSREIIASYIVETPVWKAAYKISLFSNPDKLIKIVGSALVDNVQEDAWENVQLSLVTGFPISFKYDLYAPQYRSRPYFVRPEEGSLVSSIESPMEYKSYSPPPPQFATVEGHAFSKKAGRPKRGATIREKRTPNNDLTKAGDFCKWDIQNPVTIAAHGSALVPLLEGHVTGKRVAVYDPKIRKSHPMSGVLFKNETGFQIEEGPSYIEEDGVYVGEVYLQNTQPGEEVLIPYAIDKGCTVQTDKQVAENQPKPHSSSCKKGVLTYYTHHVVVNSYTVYNSSTRPITLFIDHPLTPDIILSQPDDSNDVKLHELTEELARFKLEIEPQSAFEFLVTEKHESPVVKDLVTCSTKDFLEDLLADKGVIPDNHWPTIHKIHTLYKKANECAESYRDLSSKLDRIQKREKLIITQLKDLRETERSSVVTGATVVETRITDTTEEAALRSKLSVEIMEIAITIKSINEELETFQTTKTELEREADKIAREITFDETNPSEKRIKNTLLGKKK